MAFIYEAQSQEQASATPQSTAGSAQAKPKTKPDSEGPEAGTSEATEALQKATQNPVASLISVPIQNNNNFGINPGYRNQDVLNIQPVIPIGISKDWNLLVRWIAPIVPGHFPTSHQLRKRVSMALETWCPRFSSHQRNPGS